ncbi:MAG: DUF4430 domain-containing protein [Pirellulales bacterium]
MRLQRDFVGELTSTLPPAMRWAGRVAAGLLVTMLAVTAASAAPPKATTVRLIVDYGDGVEVHFKAIPWRDGMTVLDALAAARKHARGISFNQRGSGSSALITQIGDVKNQGGAADSKNWLYYVNEAAAEDGAGVHAIKQGDVILWRFQVYDYNS